MEFLALLLWLLLASIGLLLLPAALTAPTAAAAAGAAGAGLRARSYPECRLPGQSMKG